MAPNVALVYGSFFMGDSERDIGTIYKTFPGCEGFKVAEPVSGENFDFDMLKDCKLLILCTSSQLGYPPKNFEKFAHNLLTAATKHPGCLSHLQHAVFGNGDETYHKTFMNMPRYMDLLLEKCGSRRIYARGETGEPHAPLDTEQCRCTDWAPAMWAAAVKSVQEGSSSKPVPWDALWAKQKSETHHKVTQWDLPKLQKMMTTKVPAPPAMFSKL